MYVCVLSSHIHIKKGKHSRMVWLRCSSCVPRFGFSRRDLLCFFFRFRISYKYVLYEDVSVTSNERKSISAGISCDIKSLCVSVAQIHILWRYNKLSWVIRLSSLPPPQCTRALPIVVHNVCPLKTFAFSFLYSELPVCSIHPVGLKYIYIYMMFVYMSI